MAIKNVVLIGAGGNIGPSILNALVNSPHGYTVSALSRESSSYQPPSGVKLLKTDYSPDSLAAAFKGQDAVVSVIAGPALLEQIKIADAAIAAGVKRFIPSEFGSDTSNEIAQQYFPLFGHKHQVLSHLKSKQDQIEWTAIYTGFFFDWGLKTGFIGFNIPTKTANIYPKYKDVTFSATNVDTVGLAVAQALSPSIAPKTANKILYVRSVTVSQTELLNVFEDLTGQKWSINQVDLDAEVKTAKEKLQKGDFSGAGKLIHAVAADVRTGADWDKRGVVSNDLLELPKEDLKTTIKSLL